MTIGIILGSIRDGRNGEAVARWVLEQGEQRDDLEFELVDLAEFDVPLLTDPTPPNAADRQYSDPRVAAWSRKIDELDGYVLVTPEYNHSVPGALKNAVDCLGPEWRGKVLGCVSYGADGGVRAVEHWRQIFANFSTFVVRAQVSLDLFTEFGAGGLQLAERRAAGLAEVFDQMATEIARRV